MDRSTDKTYLFEQMPASQAVRRQILPAIASQMVLLAYNLADTYFVGLLNDPLQTAAVSVAYTITVLMTAIANLFAVGGASCMARALGRHEDTDARCIAAISFWWCLLAAVLFSGVFAWLASPLLHLCGATSETYAMAFHYAKWVVIWGGPCAIINILLANLLRAEGSAGIASAGVSLGGLINIALDPLFVLPQFLGLGAQGAGLATAISNGIGTLFLLFCIFNRRRSSVVSLRPGSMRYTAKHMGSIVKIGFPSCAQYLLTMVAVGALMKFMSAYDTDAVAALGIVKKLDMLPLYFSIGVSGGILPLLAYNYAAGNQERRHQVFKLGCGVSVLFSLVCVLTYELLAPMLVGLFIDTPATVAYGASFSANHGAGYADDGRMLPHDHPVSGYGTSEGIPDLLRAAQGRTGYPAAVSAEWITPPCTAVPWCSPLWIASLCWQLYGFTGGS